MKKVLAGLLCLIMVFCMMPVTTEASETMNADFGETGDITSYDGLR